jgi:diaminopimelate epimerase
VSLDVEGTLYTGWHVLVGVPHFVLPWPEGLDQAPVRELGRALRFHPGLGAPGANVNFVRFPAQHRLEIRTYERGVEDETLSCGTGVLAAAAVAVALGKGTLPLSVLTQSGFELEIGAGGAEGTWTLTGDARIVASGDLLPGADREPSLPHWANARG